jgi:hypothetical protein
MTCIFKACETVLIKKKNMWESYAIKKICEKHKLLKKYVFLRCYEIHVTLLDWFVRIDYKPVYR